MTKKIITELAKFNQF